MRLPRLRRPRRRRTVILIAVLAVAIVAIGVLAVVNRTPSVATRVQQVAGVPEAGQPVDLDTTLYLPAHTPAPAVLLAHGFGGSKTDLDSAARSLAHHGFVVLAYTARGFGASGGLVHLDAPAYEVADASKLVDYLATLPAVQKDAPGDPRVGVAGSSYGGGLALLLAGTDRRVDAVAADIAWNDLEHSLFPNGSGAGPGPFKKLWAGYLFQGGYGRLPSGTLCGRFASDVCAAYQQAAETGSPDAATSALLRASSPATVLAQITAPTLLSQGEQDSLFPLSEADANARGIAAHGTAVKVVWRSGGHDGNGNTDQLAALRAQWFDAHLRGRGEAATSFQLAQRSGGVAANNERRISQRVSPAYGFQSQVVTLTGPAAPISAPAGGNPAAVSVLPQVGSLLDNAAGLPNDPLNGLSAIPGQVARFASQPLDARLVIAGSSSVTLTVTAATTTDATLFVGLRDVGPDGSNVLPGGLVAPVRLTGLTPGTPRTVSVQLPGVVQAVAAGHRLVVTVSTTDFAYQLPSDPRQYVVGLAGDQLSVSTVDGRVIRDGSPVTWLVVGLVIAALVAVAVAAWTLRRRRAARPDPTLRDVPIAVRDLSKEYADGYRAVDGVTFSVERGQVVGLLGPNGAGKTTTLRMLVGLITPTSGQLYLFCAPVRPGAAVLARVGAFIEGPGFLPHLSGRDNLRLYWAASGRSDDDADFDTALEIAGLGASIDRRVKTYSHGMRQRLGIAQAMLGLPELLVLDEPTNGLDPPQIAEMREVLRRYAETGRTVVISSHLLAEVEQTCTHVVVMHKGRLVAAGSVADVAGVGRMQLALRNGADPQRAADVLAAAGIAADPVPARRALEDVFLDLVGDQ